MVHNVGRGGHGVRPATQWDWGHGGIPETDWDRSGVGSRGDV